MDETLEKKVRSLRLKLLMAEKEMQASSGKWKLGAMLGAGHANAMNREVVKVKERLEKKIESLKQEISLLTGETFASQAPKPVAERPKPFVKPVAEKPKLAAEKPKPEPLSKAAKKAAAPVKKAAQKETKPAAKKPEPKKAAPKKAAPAKTPAKKAPAKKTKKK